MNIAIIYASVHHQNTESLVKAIDVQFPNVLLIDSTKALMIDLAKYDYIGVASGIYHGKFHKTIYSFLEENLPENKKVFVMYTCGIEKPSYTHKIERFIKRRKCNLVGKYSCAGWDTHGILVLSGGIQLGHPSTEEILGAVDFVKSITQQ